MTPKAFRTLSILATTLLSFPMFQRTIFAQTGSEAVQTVSNGTDYIQSFFSEQTLLVTRSEDGLIPGTLRSVILEAEKIRRENPFTIVRIRFSESLQTIKVTKGNLPAIGQGFVFIDCQSKIKIDGTAMESFFLKEGEPVYGLRLASSDNSISGCQIDGFTGNALEISGYRNRITQNTFGGLSQKDSHPQTLGNQGFGVFLEAESSGNLIEKNRFLGNQKAGVLLGSDTGVVNLLKQNEWLKNSLGAVQVSSSAAPKNQSAGVTLSHLEKIDGGYLVTGAVRVPQTEVELYLFDPKNNSYLPLTPPLLVEQQSFSFSLDHAGFDSNSAKLVVISTEPQKAPNIFSTAFALHPEVLEKPATAQGLAAQSLPVPPLRETVRPVAPEEVTLDLTTVTLKKPDTDGLSPESILISRRIEERSRASDTIDLPTGIEESANEKRE